MNTRRKRQASSLLVPPNPGVIAPKASKPAKRKIKLKTKVAAVPRSQREVTIALAPEEDPNEACFWMGYQKSNQKRQAGTGITLTKELGLRKRYHQLRNEKRWKENSDDCRSKKN